MCLSAIHQTAGSPQYLLVCREHDSIENRMASIIIINQIMIIINQSGCGGSDCYKCLKTISGYNKTHCHFQQHINGAFSFPRQQRMDVNHTGSLSTVWWPLCLDLAPNNKKLAIVLQVKELRFLLVLQWVLWQHPKHGRGVHWLQHNKIRWYWVHPAAGIEITCEWTPNKASPLTQPWVGE